MVIPEVERWGWPLQGLKAAQALDPQTYIFDLISIFLLLDLRRFQSQMLHVACSSHLCHRKGDIALTLNLEQKASRGFFGSTLMMLLLCLTMATNGDTCRKTADERISAHIGLVCVSADFYEWKKCHLGSNCVGTQLKNQHCMSMTFDPSGGILQQTSTSPHQCADPRDDAACTDFVSLILFMRWNTDAPSC